jgi:transposase
MPITYKDYPGSINDMAEASDMILFFRELLDGEDVTDIVMIADRGYVSEDNILELRNAGIGYILLLKKNMNIMSAVLDE